MVTHNGLIAKLFYQTTKKGQHVIVRIYFYKGRDE